MRQLFQKIWDTTTDNLVIRNPSSIDWTSFPWNEGYTIHKISAIEIIKPYKISLQYYQTVDYEDIILLLNRIENIYEVVPEKELWIPNINELKTWLSARQVS